MSLSHACFQTYQIYVAPTDINGNEDVCCLCSCKALALLYTRACPLLECPGNSASCSAPQNMCSSIAVSGVSLFYSSWKVLPVSEVLLGTEQGWFVSRRCSTVVFSLLDPDQGKWGPEELYMMWDWNKSSNLISSVPYHLVSNS